MNKYYELFNTAMSMGYKLSPYAEDSDLDYLPHVGYLELCFIQKWLRDTHKMYVLVEWQHAKMFWAVVKSNTPHLETENCEADTTYEGALLNGIKEALQLI